MYTSIPISKFDPHTISVFDNCCCCCCCSVAQLCPTLCDPMDCSTQGSTVLLYLPEFAQIHVHWVSDAILLETVDDATISSSAAHFSICPQSFPGSRSFLMSQLLTSGGQRLELQFQHQFFQWIFRTDFLKGWLIWSPCCQGTLKGLLQHHSSKTSILWHLHYGSTHIHTWLLEKP